jgi:carbon-monoxide dehydrogenase medium subunit
MMKLRIASPAHLVDINRIEGLGGIRMDGDRLVFGALCRHAEIGGSDLVREHLPLLIDAARLTADVQVRNRGTMAGSLAHADPAGDWPAALWALETDVTIAGLGGRRTLPLREFILDAYTTALGTGEMVVEVSVLVPAPTAGGAYVKFEKRAGDFAVASAGVQLRVDGGRVAAAAVSLGAVGATPIRAAAAEQVLVNAEPTEARIRDAERLVCETAQPFDDTRGSAAYKCHMSGVLFRRAFEAALERARGGAVQTLHM